MNSSQFQHLERKYGGRLRAHTAAAKIQRAFRRFRLQQQWKRVSIGPVPPSAHSHSHKNCNGQSSMMPSSQLLLNRLPSSSRCLSPVGRGALRNRVYVEQPQHKSSLTSALQRGQQGQYGNRSQPALR